MDDAADRRSGAHQMPAAWWLPGAHLQTVWARIARSRHVVVFTREVLKTEDDDDLVLDHAAGPAGAPRVLLLHGLEGSAYSLHTQGLADLVARAGWRGTVLNFRSCARDPRNIRRRLRNRRPRLYHAGEIEDLDFTIRTLIAREPATPLYAIGFSLGGNVLLKWLGERGAASAVRAAATISVPYDLAASARFLDRGVGRFYGARFMNRLRAKAIDVLNRFPRETAHLDAQRIRALRTLERVRRAGDGAPARIPERRRLLRARERARLSVPRRRPHPVHQQHRRSLLPGRRAGAGPRRRLPSRHLRDHPLGRPHRLRHRPLALAPDLLGRGTRPRLAAEQTASLRSATLAEKRHPAPSPLLPTLSSSPFSPLLVCEERARVRSPGRPFPVVSPLRTSPPQQLARLVSGQGTHHSNEPPDSSLRPVQ